MKGSKDTNQETDTFTIFNIEIERHAMIGFLQLIGLLVLAWLIGPIVLALAWLLQRWAAAEIWQARDRWASVGGFAWFFGIIAVFLFVGNVFPVPVLSLMLSSIWHYLPTGWNDVVRQTVIRWFIGLPLAPLLAVLLELIRPRTTWYASRVLLDSERAYLQAQEEKQQAAEQAKAARAAKRKEQRANRQNSSHPRSQDHSIAQEGLVTSYLGQDEGTGQQQDHSVQKGHSASSETLSHEQQQTLGQETTTSSSVSGGSLSGPKQEPPPAPKKHDWNQGEGSLKDL